MNFVNLKTINVRKLAFSDEELAALRMVLMFGEDAEEHLSHAVHSFGSKRVADLIIDAKSLNISVLAVTDVNGFEEADKQRITNAMVMLVDA